LGAGFVLDAGASTAASSGTLDGTFSVATAGTTAIITRTGAATQLAAGAHDITLTNIKSPDIAGSTGTYDLRVQSGADADIDIDAAVAADTLTVGSLTAADVEPASLVAGATGNVNVSFTTATDLPADGKIVMVFPSSPGSGDRTQTDFPAAGHRRCGAGPRGRNAHGVWR